MGDQSGTIRKLTIDAITFDVPADINITFNRSKYTIEGMPTSGRPIMKFTKRVQTMNSVPVITNPAEMETLNDKSESIADKTFAIELADGSTYRATGQFNYENFETESNRSAIQIIPKGPWTPVVV